MLDAKRRSMARPAQDCVPTPRWACSLTPPPEDTDFWPKATAPEPHPGRTHPSAIASTTVAQITHTHTLVAAGGPTPQRPTHTLGGPPLSADGDAHHATTTLLPLDEPPAPAGCTSLGPRTHERPAVCRLVTARYGLRDAGTVSGLQARIRSVRGGHAISSAILASGPEAQRVCIRPQRRRSGNNSWVSHTCGFCASLLAVLEGGVLDTRSMHVATCLLLRPNRPTTRQPPRPLDFPNVTG